MPRFRRSSSSASTRGLSRNRHGRGMRSAVTGPHLPRLHSRVDTFDFTVASAAEFLKDAWPAELADVVFEVGGVPPNLTGVDGVDRWQVFPAERRVVLYRLPIERLAHLHRNDEPHKRMMIESCVFRAVAELLGKDPWDLAPDRFRHF
jgi:hypothetical protein